MGHKVEECHEIKTIMQELKIRRGDDAIRDQSLGIEAGLGTFEKVVEELEELEQKLSEQEARETQEKGRKRDLTSRRNSKRKQLRRRVMQVNRKLNHPNLW